MIGKIAAGALFLVGILGTDLRGGEAEVGNVPEGYRSEEIEGWNVVLSDTIFSEDPEVGQKLLTTLRKKLAEVSKVVPERRVKFLQGVRLWVEWADEGRSPIVYHRSDEWLRRSGRNPAKARCVEILDVKGFLFRVGRQPMILLHELSHAYHHQEIGLDDPLVEEAYRKAVASGSYDSVRRGRSSELVKAYALTNAEEYFAELSEAFFGRNDYFPFTREDLKAHDPDGYLLMSRLWLLR